MNTISITGRLTKDIEMQTTSSNVNYARFNVAVVSEYKTENGDYKVDFFTCVVWRELAERIAQYFHKGSPIELYGSMNSRQYQTPENQTKTVWELNVKGFNFPPISKDENEKNVKQHNSNQTEMTPIDDDDLPF